MSLVRCPHNTTSKEDVTPWRDDYGERDDWRRHEREHDLAAMTAATQAHQKLCFDDSPHLNQPPSGKIKGLSVPQPGSGPLTLPEAGKGRDEMGSHISKRLSCCLTFERLITYPFVPGINLIKNRNTHAKPLNSN